jgi:ATP-dependent Lon protease
MKDSAQDKPGPAPGGAGETPGQTDEEIRIPASLPVLPLKDTVAFPEILLPLVVGRERSVQLIDDAVPQKQLIALVAQKNPEIEEPKGDDVHRIGTAARVVKLLKFPDGTFRVLVKGIGRIRILRIVQEEPYPVADIEALKEIQQDGVEIEGLAKNLLTQIKKMLSMMPMVPDEVGHAFMHVAEPSYLADLAASSFVKSLPKKQEFLGTLDVRERLVKMTRLINKEISILEVGSKIQQQVQSEMNDRQREMILRQQLKAIQEELGEKDESAAAIEDLEKRLAEAKLPEEVEKEARRELDRLKSIPTASPEHNVARTYLEWLASLPWQKETTDRLDVAAARTVLDEDHDDLEKVKDRILEYLAVRSLRNDTRGPILCFVGPPGTGKTSLGRSIARAMGRKFHRISLGGVRDEAEIRGHRRTYVGALPGRIIQGLRKCGTRNPIFMLDEVDKLGQDFRGDPSSALLEVLDPEQNFSFSDHYLDVPFDLSRIMFITTGNVLETIPGPLRDRMEVIELPGYTDDQKLLIARHHLIPRQVREHGLEPDQIEFDDGAVRAMIRRYTREAGLRNLERQIASVCRKVARRFAEGDKTPVKVGEADIAGFLGPRKFFEEMAERTDRPGVAIGLAWTPYGGEILFVESTRMPGKGGLTLTGQLGDVMRESAQAALSYVRSQWKTLDLDKDVFAGTDLHIHVPAGAIPKDGPSAGVAIVSSLVSLLSDRPCRSDTAMTGEITLRGRVLPVGGIKEKVLAARRAGLKKIILPCRNEKDLAELPEEIRNEMHFTCVDTIDAVLEHVFATVATGTTAPGA